MKLTTLDRKKYRIKNKLKKVSKEGRFRLSISRSSKNISAQIIDDVRNITLISASSKLLLCIPLKLISNNPGVWLKNNGLGLSNK